MDVEAPLQQGLEAPLVSGGVEQVGDQHGQPRLARAERVGHERLREPRGAFAAQTGGELEQREQLPAPARGAPALGHAIANDGDTHPLVAGEADEAQGGGQARGVAELAGLPEAHRRRAVEEEVQAQILLVHEELEIEAVEAAVDVPVDVTEVVPGAIGPVVGELDAHPLAGTLALAAGATPEGPARQEGEPLELEEELGREQVLTAGRSGHELSLVQRLEVLLHLPVIVARDLLAGDVLFHLLAVLAEHPEVLQPRGYLAAASDHVGVDAFLSPRR